MRMKKEPPRQSVNQILLIMLRLRVCIGTVALTPLRYWMTLKPRRKTPEKTKREIILAEDQAYWKPPHWRARRRQTMPGMKKAVPGRSNRRSRACHVSLVDACVFKAVEVNVKRTPRATAAPIGRFI